MPTINDIINDVIKREGAPTNDPLDKGGKTVFGISETANPEAWADGKVTEDEARRIYVKKYVEWPKFDTIPDPTLQTQLVDYGVTSGPQLVIGKLQAIVGVPVDHVLGPKTLEAIAHFGYRETNNALVASRIKMCVGIALKDRSQLGYLAGWVNRALEFLS